MEKMDTSDLKKMKNLNVEWTLLLPMVLLAKMMESSNKKFADSAEC